MLRPIIPRKTTWQNRQNWMDFVALISRGNLRAELYLIELITTGVFLECDNFGSDKRSSESLYIFLITSWHLRQQSEASYLSFYLVKGRNNNDIASALIQQSGIERDTYLGYFLNFHKVSLKLHLLFKPHDNPSCFVCITQSLIIFNLFNPPV